MILVCCLAHCRRKFYEAVPTGRRKKRKLLDINSEEELKEPSSGMSDDNGLLPAEKGVAFCNRLFFLERCYKELPAEERKQKRQEKEPEIWSEFIKENCSGITDTEKILPENRGDLPI